LGGIFPIPLKSISPPAEFSYLFTVSSFTESTHSSLNQVTVPDLWQQQAVAGLREGRDVVVQAPTGAGKTLIFELWSMAARIAGRPFTRFRPRRAGQ